MYLPLQCGINIRFLSSCVGSYCVKTVCGVLRAASLATPFEIFSHCVDLKASNKHLRPLHLPCLCASAQNLYECYLGRKEKNCVVCINQIQNLPQRMDHLPSAACCCVLLPKWREPLRPQQAWRTALPQEEVRSAPVSAMNLPPPIHGEPKVPGNPSPSGEWLTLPLYILSCSVN